MSPVWLGLQRGFLCKKFVFECRSGIVAFRLPDRTVFPSGQNLGTHVAHVDVALVAAVILCS